MCNSGVGLTPIIEGNVYHFGVPGMINGLAVLRDEETLSLWDHITGECFEGPMTGARMEFWSVEVTTVAAELKAHPQVLLIESDYRSFKSRLMNLVTGGKFIDSERNLSSRRVRATMNGEPDPRLPARTQGLGVMTETHKAKFYPMDEIERGGQIEDRWLGRPLIIRRDAVSGVPSAEWADSGEIPMQLLSRWYGFAFTYPECELYEAE